MFQSKYMKISRSVNPKIRGFLFKVNSLTIVSVWTVGYLRKGFAQHTSYLYYNNLTMKPISLVRVIFFFKKKPLNKTEGETQRNCCRE